MLRSRLVTDNMGLVYMVTKRFEGRGTDREELVQIGAIGLIKAIDKFDPKLPYSLSTYAVPLIIGEIRRFLRDDGMIHISRSVKENARKIALIREKLKKTENKEPTMEELRELTGLEYEEIVTAMEASSEVDSIFRPVAGEEGDTLTLGERLADERQFENPLVNSIALRQVMETLDEGENRLIELRYMQNKTQSETAKLLGTNQVAVSRMEKKILIKLRQRLCFME